MPVTSKLLVKLHVDGQKAGIAYGACATNHFRSTRIEMKRMVGKGKCKQLYSYYLRCASTLDSVAKYSALMYSEHQRRICSCILGAIRQTFGDAVEIECYDGFLEDIVDRQPLHIGDDYRAFCADANPVISIYVRPAHGRTLLTPRRDLPFTTDAHHVYTAFFTYFDVSPHACSGRRGACATIPPNIRSYIYSKLLYNLMMLGEVFSTAEQMHLKHWPIASEGAGARDFNRKYGYKLLKYHFTQVYKSRLVPGAASVTEIAAAVGRTRTPSKGHYEVRLSGSWEEDMRQTVHRALIKGFTGRRQNVPEVEHLREGFLVTFDRDD